ncbi:MAG: hypothetical protein AB8B59_00985 [Maribacter sp.]
MKIINRTVAIVIAILATSCGKDTANAIASIFDDEVEQIESTVLDAENVSDNVVIIGGTKMEGAPPSSSGIISLDLSESGKTAFLDEGFDVSLSSDAEITGAYIQFKSKEGSSSNSYYDVNLDENSSSESDKSSRRRRVKKSGRSTLSRKTNDINLDVDFNTNIRPGEFCYEICVYDANGNISEPQEVCLTVEAWGGKSELVASWNLTKETEAFDGNSSVLLVGEELCSEESSFDCDQGGEYMAKYACYTSEPFVIEFKEDGTYRYDSKESGKLINDVSSRESCEAIYDEFRDDYISNGRWAYVSDENRLILLEYSFSESYKGEIESGTYESGDAQVLLDINAAFDGSTLILTEEGIDYAESYYFEK